MLKKQSWLIPANTAILCGILCFWAVQNHDTVFAVILCIVCLVNCYFTYMWLRMRRSTKS